ncbi:MAG TPA: 4Fe-4S binding protein [Dissulfurispiraceae bacterium]|nr:4Fe-4S binding protein [Dissulfurispiraceae bacterium]
MNLVQFRRKRRSLQTYTWLGLPLVVIGGWFYPLLGFLLLGCMVGAVAIAVTRGRQWCDWLCPRGSFYDLFLDRLSTKRTIPSFFRKTSARVGVIALLFTVLGVQFYFAWPSVEGIGKAFVVVLTVTTSIGILLGIGIHPRTWCHVCPMGSLANWISRGKKPLLIADSCVDCRVCERVCPMQLSPYRDKAHGRLRDNDCVKCGTCVAACPKKALVFADKKAA